MHQVNAYIWKKRERDVAQKQIAGPIATGAVHSAVAAAASAKRRIFVPQGGGSSGFLGFDGGKIGRVKFGTTFLAPSWDARFDDEDVDDDGELDSRSNAWVIIGARSDADDKGEGKITLDSRDILGGTMPSGAAPRSYVEHVDKKCQEGDHGHPNARIPGISDRCDGSKDDCSTEL